MASLNEKRDLTTGVVWKKLLIFFLPIAAGTCIQQLYNAVDGMVVGRFVGTAALASVGGSAAQIINLLIGFFISVTTGASVLIAQIFGAGRYEDIRKASGSAIMMCLLMGLVLTVFGLFAAPALLSVLKTPADTFAGSVLYLRIYFIGVPFILILNMESNMLRAVGDSVSPFIYMVAGCVFNIILDFVFVVFFNWGIAGVAIATVLSQILNMALLTAKLFRSGGEYGLALSDLGLKKQFISGMLRIGIPAGFQASMFSISNMVIQVGVNTLGTIVVASWAMTSKIDGLYWAVSHALGAAITSFVGQNIGAGDYDRVRQCIKQGMILSISITVFLSSAIMLLGRPLLKILTTDRDVISTTYTMMTYFVPYYFTWTLIEVISAVLRGAGDAIKPVIIIGLGICLFRIIWILTVFAAFHTVLVLSLSYVTSWVITGIALFIYYRRGTWLDNARNKIISH
ncbi:MAG: MATE family efflux transporter [Oscillospiraceae bacterium]|nr:MATE family efflux transporter [Oscillospiraceae bacterium]